MKESFDSGTVELQKSMCLSLWLQQNSISNLRIWRQLCCLYNYHGSRLQLYALRPILWCRLNASTLGDEFIKFISLSTSQWTIVVEIVNDSFRTSFSYLLTYTNLEKCTDTDSAMSYRVVAVAVASVEKIKILVPIQYTYEYFIDIKILFSRWLLLHKIQIVRRYWRQVNEPVAI